MRSKADVRLRAARQQIFWKRVRQRGALIGGST
jgi:hypothetical protein